MPVPLHKGQALSREARMALRMNSERLEMSSMAFFNEASTLKEITSSLRFMFSLPVRG
jgi:hypothetical protein